MKSLILIIAVLMVVIGVTVCSSVASKDDVTVENPVSETIESNLTSKPKKTLRAFRSQKELNDFLRQIAEKQMRSRKDEAKSSSNSMATTPSASPDGLAAAEADDSVTNVQHAGVDEGGIVKLHGDYLIILRRGRLFTVSINDNSLRPISTVDAFRAGH